MAILRLEDGTTYTALNDIAHELAPVNIQLNHWFVGDNPHLHRLLAQEILNEEEKEQVLTQNFCAYLDKHWERIVNYGYYQAEQLCSIGSGAVESAVKQIDRRLKISGAQWNPKNVNQMLQLRSCYLNGLLAI